LIRSVGPVMITIHEGYAMVVLSIISHMRIVIYNIIINFETTQYT